MKFMKTTLLIACTVIASSVILTETVANAQPGTTEDPLVSRSYVESQLNQLKTIMNNSLARIEASIPEQQEIDYAEIVSDAVSQIIFLYGDILTNNQPATVPEPIIIQPTPTPELNIPVSNFVPVRASKDQIIIGSEGAEILLRSGSAVAYTVVTDGLVNATVGSELVNNDPISRNNLLLVPRDDGRGVKVTSSDAWFIIKGDYSIIN